MNKVIMNEELNKLFEIKNAQPEESTDSDVFNIIIHLVIRIIIPLFIFFLLYSIVDYSGNIGIAYIVFFISLFILFFIIVTLLIEASNLNKKNKIYLRNTNYVILAFYALPFILGLIIVAKNS
ncbi:hypothetical protein B0A68_00520 [Flavobacterium reichenbachii]|uniref:Uncharacterized protein n=1 Tax=Flavobacterium reichenbachii TaxID=362418 RepID=A0A085ZR00_9FLAO|nr:hypothetical protein IW19_15710 [Flavobacterium reichenbachii]OXB18540.1 hypothetical protein B0A68_00520 [Flavobacterium reichenbachii]